MGPETGKTGKWRRHKLLLVALAFNISCPTYSSVYPFFSPFLPFNPLIVLFFSPIFCLSFFNPHSLIAVFQDLLLTVSTYFCHLLGIFHHHWKMKEDALKTLSTCAWKGMWIFPNWQTVPLTGGNDIRCSSKQGLLCFFQALTLKCHLYYLPFFQSMDQASLWSFFYEIKYSRKLDLSCPSRTYCEFRMQFPSFTSI